MNRYGFAFVAIAIAACGASSETPLDYAPDALVDPDGFEPPLPDSSSDTPGDETADSAPHAVPDAAIDVSEDASDDATIADASTDTAEPDAGPDAAEDDAGPDAPVEDVSVPTDGQVDAPDDGSANDANQTLDAPEHDGAIEPDASAPVHHLRMDVFLILKHAFCITGPECTDPSTEDCAPVYEDGQLKHRFAQGLHISGAPGSPVFENSPYPVFCLETQITSEAQARVREELLAFQAQAWNWTEGTLVLDMHFHEVPYLEAGMIGAWKGLWLPPWTTRSTIVESVGIESDSIFVTSGNFDPTNNRAYDVGMCGGAYGSDLGIRGAGYAWVPQTSDAVWYECADRGVYGHEWLHQVEFALPYLSGYEDLYLDEQTRQRNYPACGEGDDDPHRWFPSTHDCLVDPDSQWCGALGCGDNESVNRHILEVHFNPEQTLVMNHCRDGIRNFSETGVDRGGECDLATAQVQTMSWQMIPPRRFTPVPR